MCTPSALVKVSRQLESKKKKNTCLTSTSQVHFRKCTKGHEIKHGWTSVAQISVVLSGKITMAPHCTKDDCLSVLLCPCLHSSHKKH